MRHLEQFGEHSELEHLSSEVTDCGEFASFSLRYSGLPDFRVALKFKDLGGAMLDLKRTAARMVRARAAWPDKGRSALMETADHAIVPTKIDVIINPRTGERTIIAQSDDTAPVAIKLTPFEAEILMERLLVLKRLSGN